jgi:hypothetical protein
MTEAIVKVGDTIALPDRNRTFAKIDRIEQGKAFYGTNQHVALEKLIPAANGFDDCWEIDPSRS